MPYHTADYLIIDRTLQHILIFITHKPMEKGAIDQYKQAAKLEQNIRKEEAISLAH